MMHSSIPSSQIGDGQVNGNIEPVLSQKLVNASITDEY